MANVKQSYEELLDQLKKYANDFAAIGDWKAIWKNDSNKVLEKYAKVVQYYKYIIKNFKDSNKQIEAMEVVDDILDINPSLELFVDRLLFPEKNQEMFNSNALINKIEAYTSEIHDMKRWDPEEVKDIRWILEKCKKELLEHKSLFDDQKYNYLMNQINSALEKISKFFKTINDLPTFHY